MGTVPRSCRRCGAVRHSDAPSALAWACERTPGGDDQNVKVHWLCPECARRHVRDIEAKLPARWW